MSRDLPPLFPAPAASRDSSFTRRDFARIAFKYLGTIMSCSVLVSAVVVAGVLMLPPDYTAEAKVLVNTEQQGTPSFFSGVAAYRERNDADPVNRRMETEMELVEIAPISEEVVRTLNLSLDQVSRAPIDHLLAPVTRLMNWLSLLLLNKPPDPDATGLRATVAAMQKAIKVEPLKSKSADANSNIISISLRSPDAARAQQALGIVLTAYTQFDIRLNRQAGESALAIVDRELKTAEAALRNIEEQQRTFLNEHPSFADLATGATGSGAPKEESIIAQLKRREIDLELELSTLRQTYYDRAPRVRSLLGSLAEVKARIASEVGRGASDVVAFNAIKRDLDAAEKRTGELTSKRSQIALFLDMNERQSGNRVVIESPELPKDSGKKKKILIAAVGCLVGVLLGLGLAGFFQYNDHRLQTKNDVRHHLGIPMLAQLPQTSPRQVRALFGQESP